MQTDTIPRSVNIVGLEIEDSPRKNWQILKENKDLTFVKRSDIGRLNKIKTVLFQ